MPQRVSRTFQARRALLRSLAPRYQQALFLAWKATHYVCAKRLLPSLPSLVMLLEEQGSLQLTEEERRQLAYHPFISRSSTARAKSASSILCLSE